jgi:coproporphyrinogen III oxidase
MKKESVVSFLKSLRDEIRTTFETLEPSARFTQTDWNHGGGGGGEISLLRGDVFEKAAVNFSAVRGKEFPTKEAEGPFFATGVSLITHMKNPFAPTVHMNVRYIETQNRTWFGGGYDLTPMGFFFEEDKAHFHEVARNATGSYYPLFSKQAADYFYIPHRKKERGVGGIFFDHFNTGNEEEDLKLWKSVGSTFTEAIMPILKRRIDTPYTETEKQRQKELRAHYVEFNLLYDRGTKFGFLSGGNPDAILCSMPPEAAW